MLLKTEGEFITSSELNTKSRRGNNKKINAETMFVEEQTTTKLPMNKFRLAIRRTFLIISTLVFWKLIFGGNNEAKRSQNKASWGLRNIYKE